MKEVGFTGLWLPPASKAANNPSMGYDVYDYYDSDEFDQKGSIRTWFGSKDELVSLIAAAHEAGLQAYADLVINHNSGGDKSTPKSDREFANLHISRLLRLKIYCSKFKNCLIKETLSSEGIAIKLLNPFSLLRKIMYRDIQSGYHRTRLLMFM